MDGDGRPIVTFWRAEENITTFGVLDTQSGHVLNAGPVIAPFEWSLSLDRRFVVASSWDARTYTSTNVLVWRVGTPATEARGVPIGTQVLQITTCGADTACVITHDKRLVRIRMSDAKVDGSFALPSDTLDDIVGSPDGRTLAIARPDGIVRLIDARTGHELRQLGGGGRAMRVLAFSPDGSRVVAGDFSTVLMWRTDRGGPPEKLDAHSGRVLTADWSSDGSTLATAGDDGTVIRWDTTRRRRVGAVLTDAVDDTATVWPDDTSTLWAMPGAIVVGQYGGGVVFVDPADGTIHRADPPGTAAIFSARTGRAGDLLVTAAEDGVTAVWDVPTRRLLGTVDLPSLWPGFRVEAWLSPDGTQAATIRNGLGPVVFDPATRKVLRQLAPLPEPISVLSTALQGWTADGRSLLITRQVSEAESELLIVDATTGAAKVRVSTGDHVALEAAADPTGRFIAMAVDDGTLRIVDAVDGHDLAPPLQANAGATINVSISPDGRYIATSGSPPRVVVWDSRTFRSVGIPLPLDVDVVAARARFAPDGRLVVATGAVLRVFTIDPPQWLARACRTAGRTLTPAEFEEVLPSRPYAPACA